MLTRSELGYFSEFFRIMEGTKRSLQPTHSLSAIGRHATNLIEGHELRSRPFCRNSIWGKLYEADALIILLGVHPMTNSFFHAIEDWSNDPFRYQSRKKLFKIIDINKKIQRRSFYLHNFHPGRKNIISLLEEEKIITKFCLPISQGYCISAKQLIDFLLPKVTCFPPWFYSTTKECLPGIARALQQSVRMRSIRPFFHILKMHACRSKTIFSFCN